jgi:endo-1,4-beta-xylanase
MQVPVKQINMPKESLIGRRRVLYLGLSTLIGIGVAASGRVTEPSLKTRAAARGLIYGATSKYKILSSDVEFSRRFLEECAILVPENELKWKNIRPSPQEFDFRAGDWLAEFARTHGLLFRGTPLVWYKSLPKWFAEKVDRQNAEPLLIDHIETLLKHYAGRVHSWDVVNEAIHPDDRRSDGLRKSPWLELLGVDYIDLAFRVAAASDPQTLLVYNDYDLDYDTPQQEAKRTATLKLLERLKSKGTPIHAFGMQAHLMGAETRFNPTKLRKFLEDIASLGLKIMITEMDVADRGLPVDWRDRDRIVAKVYQQYLETVMEEPALIAVLTWGLSDRYTWLDRHQARQDGQPVRPLPLDKNFQPKLAWHSIARAIDLRLPI